MARGLTILADRVDTSRALPHSREDIRHRPDTSLRADTSSRLSLHSSSQEYSSQACSHRVMLRFSSRLHSRQQERTCRKTISHSNEQKTKNTEYLS